jgi:hypothetical protein
MTQGAKIHPIVSAPLSDGSDWIGNQQVDTVIEPKAISRHTMRSKFWALRMHKYWSLYLQVTCMSAPNAAK